MKRVFIIFLVLISCQEKQQKESILNDCLTTEQVSLLNKMISSFENDVCRYYNLPKDETDKSIINYLNEIKAMSENSSEEVSIVLKIASNKSKQLLKDSFDILSDDVWISYEEENNSKGIMNSYEQNALEKFKIDTVDAQEVNSLILEDDFEIVDIPILEKGEVLKDRLEKDSIDREEMIKKYRNKHYLRIYGKLVDCIYKKNKK